MEIINTLWVEKYRPKTIDDLVLPEEYSLDFKKSIEKQDIPHLLFYGPPGSGKSSIARILTSKDGIIQNKNDNVLEINGSAKETRGISYVQDGIEPFLKIPPAGNDKYKIVFIDEMDYMCLEGNQEIKIIINNNIQNIKIKDLKDQQNIKVLSVNIDTKEVEIDEAIYIDSGIAEMYEVELENSEIIICSKNHPFFIIDENNSIIEKELKELNIRDSLITYE